MMKQIVECPECDIPMRFERETRPVNPRFLHADFYWCPGCGYREEVEAPGEEERVRY